MKIHNSLYSYKLISQNQKIENEKERLLSKFNFNVSRETTKNSGYIKKLIVEKKEKSLIIRNNKNFRSRNKTKEKSTKKEQKSTIQIYRIKQRIKPIKIINNQNKKNKVNSKCNQTLNFSMNNSNKLNKFKRGNKKEKIDNVKGYLMRKISEKIISNIRQKDNSQSFSNSIMNSKKRNNKSNLIKSGSYLIDNYTSFFSTSQKFYLQTQTQESFLKDDLSEEGLNKNRKVEDENVKISNLSYLEQKSNNHINIKKGEAESISKTNFSINSDNSELNGDNIPFKINHQYRNINNINNIKISYNYIRNNNNINKKLRGYTNSKESDGFPVPGFLKKITEDGSTERKITEVNNSELLDDEEYNKKTRNKNKMIYRATKFKFISDVVNKNNSIICLSYEKYMNLNSKAKFIIFSFVYDNYYQLFNISKSFRKIINDFLNEKFKYIIFDFKSKYNKLFHLDKYHFDIYSIQKNRTKPRVKLDKSFSLFLKAKIIKDNEYIKKKKNVSFELSYNFKIKKKKNDSYIYNNGKTLISNNTYNSNHDKIEEFTEIFQFDLRKNKFFPIWIYCEKNCPNNDYDKDGIKDNESNTFIISSLVRNKHLIYSSPVINICENDYIIFKIDIIKNNNIIGKVSFNELKENLAQTDYYQKQLYGQNKIFDRIRDCEVEKMINQWKEFSLLNNNETTEYINNIIKIFCPLFEVVSIKYDKSKFLFFKIILKAIKIGKIAKNFFVNKNILIVDENVPITRECVNINLINTFSLHKNISIRKGASLIFYLSE